MDAATAREKMIARRFGGAQQSRTGGKGSVRRKKKTVHKTATSDDKKLGTFKAASRRWKTRGGTLKKLGVARGVAATPSLSRESARKPDTYAFLSSAVTNIPAIEEVNLFTADGNVIHFANPKVQASIAANTYVVSGPNETKQLTEMLPGIMNQLGPDNINQLKMIADNMSAGGGAAAAPAAAVDDEDDEDVPDLVENFEDISKQ